MTQNKIPVYFLSVPVSLAYGKEFASMQTEYFIKGQDRADFYELYKKTLSILTSGDKIILSNRWDIMFDLYVAENRSIRQKQILKSILMTFFMTWMNRSHLIHSFSSTL